VEGYRWEWAQVKVELGVVAGEFKRANLRNPGAVLIYNSPIPIDLLHEYVCATAA
jgi:hypothetical protein